MVSARPPSAAASVATASVCAFAIIATQVAGKATRDVLFLTHFDISSLPLVLIASATLSIGAVLLSARAMNLFGPSRVIPPFFLASALLLVAEWLLVARDPRLASVLVYLHVVVIGSILISGFWSIINDSFDPHSARRNIGRIVGGATVGGLFGGLLVERVGASAGIANVLPMVAGLHLLCAVLLPRIKPVGGSPPPASFRSFLAMRRDPDADESGFRVLRRVSYVRNLALIVLLGNIAATLIDYLFKARAAQSFPSDVELGRFFAVFYTAVSVLTLAVQTGLTHRLLAGIGVANTIAIRPALTALGGLATLPLLSLTGLGALRAVEAVAQSSLFRSAYELLFTPVVPGDRRASRAIVDVGADRMGDILGAVIIRTLILLPVMVADYALVLVSVLFSILGFVVARAMNRGYIGALEASLLHRADALEIRKEDSPGLRTMMMESFVGIDPSITATGLALDELRSRTRTGQSDALASGQQVPFGTTITSIMGPVVDAEVASLIELRSGNASRVHAELTRNRSLTGLIAGQVITLLAWDDVSGWASRALAKAAPGITGQLVDHLLDPNEDFAIRRRIPRILSTCLTKRAVDGLVSALADDRFEVRFQSARALARIREQLSSLVVDERVVYAAVMRETSVAPSLWNEQRVLDEPEMNVPVIDEKLQGRASRRMEHVFTVLSLVAPRDPLQIAFKGLMTSDALLRGTGLEYLESILPRDVWTALRPFLDESGERPPSERPREEVLEDLLRSRESVELNLEEIRKNLKNG